MQPGYPFLREYRDAHLLKVAMPLGGIGTGTVSLGGRGRPARLGADEPAVEGLRAPAGRLLGSPPGRRSCCTRM